MSFGSVIIESMRLKDNYSDILKVINYSPQVPNCLRHLSGRQMLHMHCLFNGIPKKDIDKIIDNISKVLDFYFELDVKIKHYSDGYIRRLTIAISLLGYSHIIFLESPTLNLDLPGRRAVWRVLQSIKKTGRTIILSTVKPFECQRICDRMAIIAGGTFKFVGNTRQLLSFNKPEYLLFFKIRNYALGGRTSRKSSKYLGILSFMELKFPNAILRLEIYTKYYAEKNVFALLLQRNC